MSDFPEDYPYASVEAERRIKTVTTIISFVSVGMLLVGLYLALLTPSIGPGSLLTLIGFEALIFLPFIGKRMRNAALAREAGQDA